MFSTVFKKEFINFVRDFFVFLVVVLVLELSLAREVPYYRHYMTQALFALLIFQIGSHTVLDAIFITFLINLRKYLT
jgi:alpha-N-acetylglucosamine transferase